MFPLVEFPKLVRHYAPKFESVFSPEAFQEFERYISGLIVSENKTVDGMNRLFVHESCHQSSLNCLLTACPFSLEALNQARLAVLDSLQGTQMKRNGVLSVDDTSVQPRDLLLSCIAGPSKGKSALLWAVEQDLVSGSAISRAPTI